jgi:signal transduction histidine kinase
MDMARFFADIAAAVGRWVKRRSRAELAALSFVLVLAIGYVDYITGPGITLSVIYVIPISVAAWFVGPRTAFALAVLSVAVWLGGDMAAGKTFSSYLVPLWNGTIRLAFYAFVVVLLDNLSRLQRDLERRVEERAQALTREIAERERLERDLLEVSEREQRRIGRDLHDGLCQHLTGTALAGHVLAEKLAERGVPESSDSRRIVDYVEEAILLARGMAKGLHPVEMEADGLMQALDEFAVTTSEMFGVACRFECDSPVLVRNPAIASHLFRIAQEAVGNAIKHGEATAVAMSLDAFESGLRLAISDDGCGMAPSPRRSGGMGLRIMADRAKMIGGTLTIEKGRLGGAELILTIPLLENPAQPSYA